MRMSGTFGLRTCGMMKSGIAPANRNVRVGYSGDELSNRLVLDAAASGNIASISKTYGVRYESHHRLQIFGCR